MVERGQLRPYVGATYSFAEILLAHAREQYQSSVLTWPTEEVLLYAIASLPVIAHQIHGFKSAFDEEAHLPTRRRAEPAISSKLRD